MALDPNKIEGLYDAAEGCMIGRCPACAETGGDNKEEHLIVYPDGKFGCVANPNDDEHRKHIWRLAGKRTSGGGGGGGCKGNKRATEKGGEPRSIRSDEQKTSVVRLSVRVPKYPKLDLDGKSRILRTASLNSLAMEEKGGLQGEIIIKKSDPQPSAPSEITPPDSVWGDEQDPSEPSAPACCDDDWYYDDDEELPATATTCLNGKHEQDGTCRRPSKDPSAHCDYDFTSTFQR